MKSKMKKETPLSEKITNQRCCKCGDTGIMVFNEEDVKEAVEKLKEDIEVGYLGNNKETRKEIRGLAIRQRNMIDKIFGEFK